MRERIIETEDCLLEGSKDLAGRFPEFARAINLVGPLSLRHRPDGFSQLLSAIVSQQLSVAAARRVGPAPSRTARRATTPAQGPRSG